MSITKETITHPHSEELRPIKWHSEAYMPSLRRYLCALSIDNSRDQLFCTLHNLNPFRQISPYHPDLNLPVLQSDRKMDNLTNSLNENTWTDAQKLLFIEGQISLATFLGHINYHRINESGELKNLVKVLNIKSYSPDIYSVLKVKIINAALDSSNQSNIQDDFHFVTQGDEFQNKVRDLNSAITSFKKLMKDQFGLNLTPHSPSQVFSVFTQMTL